jgi:hypothetical protein
MRVCCAACVCAALRCVMLAALRPRLLRLTTGTTQPLNPPDQHKPVACVDGDVTDGFGAQLGRKGACKDTSSSVTVTITDTCACAAGWVEHA